MSLTYGILGFLSYGSMTGYDLAKAFSCSVNFFWNAQTSQIYRELGKLEEEGLVASELVLQTQRPNKKLYAITDEGKRRFRAWLSSREGMAQPMKNAFLMKVFFSGFEAPQESIRLLQDYRRQLLEAQERMRSIPADMEAYGRDMEAYPTLYWEMAADFGGRYMQMALDWAQACIDRLEAIR
mgnify:CR=1 FL=1